MVSRFAEDYNVTMADAEEVFTEMKRWLWICAKRKMAVDGGHVDFIRVPLFNEVNVIDKMWHTFLLYTQDYAHFCHYYFGFFIHHEPRSKAERLEWQKLIAADPERAWQERKDDLKKVYEYLYDELGPETLLKWCEDFPARFNKDGVMSPRQPDDFVVTAEA